MSHFLAYAETGTIFLGLLARLRNDTFVKEVLKKCTVDMIISDFSRDIIVLVLCKIFLYAS